MSRHARSSPHSYPARLRRAHKPEPKGFSASWNPRSCHAMRVHRRILTPRISAGTYAQSPRRFPAATASQNSAVRTRFRAFGLHRRTLTPRVSVGQMRPKPSPQAHFRRKYCSPQASAQAGIRAHIALRAPIAAFSPRASPQGIHAKPAPQAHFRRKHCSPQASTQAGNRVHVAPRAFIAAFSPRASP